MEIPYPNGLVVGGGEKVFAAGVESDGSDPIVVSVLHEEGVLVEVGGADSHHAHEDLQTLSRLCIP